MSDAISGASIYVKRGTRAQFDAAATAGELAASEPYFISDEGRFAMGTSANSYVTYAIALTQDLSLYVSSTGSDSNDGLSAATAFQTIQRAVNVVRARYSLCGYTVSINVADGTYVENVSMGNVTGGVVRLVGSSSAIWRNTTGWVLVVDAGSTVQISGFAFGGGSTANDIVISYRASCTFQGGHVFAAMTGSQIVVTGNGVCYVAGNYSITGGGVCHYGVFDGGQLVLRSITVTLISTPAFANAGRVGSINGGDATFTFSGAATGARYGINANGVIWVNGKGPSAFPGNVAGYVNTGGSYS
ncbi:hypothetical protein [Xanthomonas phaseoli]|uniref:hypothetical protein n=1 Tax=Xanthomonas phaseoli TaxID=1985254 RepID=UPI00123805C8|nr:hypothetical protein [Xanthomonas phaseoli]MBO9832855.1 hypothetical protein [Xanthomonas phaseoli pv. dieffenbachiae]MBO9835268.1 hypothetical protein [Xanthomonas phaseoli pv. dieffenbachiae]MBO9842446.1 hypothetical protein [Xanthomonas phaseoli pv. dieffenbachiae]MBO9860836.1 hypothetical protein [Xanthomonas phaseoli pv. dieffenbachiae]MBO9863690.1 hypothetical protein [Xanthomonas phaseoli pv. dieffenbachiae]